MIKKTKHPKTKKEQESVWTQLMPEGPYQIVFPDGTITRSDVLEETKK